MSKKRYIDTNFWVDGWIANLNRDEKYFFLYLLTNDKTSIAGVYEIPMKVIVFETEFEHSEVLTMLNKMKAKVVYMNGWIVLRKAIKNQNYRNEKIRRAIQIILEDCPSELLDFVDIPKDFGAKITTKPKGPQQQQLLDESSMSHLPQKKKDSSAVEKDDSSMTLDESSHLIELNRIEFNSKEPDKPPGTKQVLSKSQRRNYAIAMDKERAQKARAENARTRNPKTKLSPMSDEVEKFYERRTK